MLNLSDKELDRLSREAAENHDPGDVTGSRSWDRLSHRLDRELGKRALNPWRTIRRIPFYYASAILLIAGVSFYFARQNKHSGSPPFAAGQQPAAATFKADSSSTLNAEHKENSTRTNPDLTTGANDATHSAAGGTTASGTTDAANSASASRTAGSGSAPSTNSATASAGVDGKTTATASRTAGSGSAPSTNSANASLPAANPALSGASARSSREAASTSATTGKTAGVNSAVHQLATTSLSHNAALLHNSATNRIVHRNRHPHHPDGTASGKTGSSRLNNDGQFSQSAPSNDGQGIAGNPHGSSRDQHRNSGKSDGGSTTTSGDPDIAQSGADGIASTDANKTTSGNAASAALRELAATRIQHPGRLSRTPDINDSALRHFTAKRTPIVLPPKTTQVSHVWAFGISAAPDFTSVKSLTGDKPGSSIGLTADWQIVHRFYLSSGLFLTRKNYAANSRDFHTPPDYYQANGMRNDMAFVKGSIHMLEIPLNVRYDFGVAGNTLFFFSAGTSSYFAAKESDSYYFPFFGRLAYRNIQYPGSSSYLLATVNLSVGVEAALSNSMSLLVAPYVKLPSRNIGFGQVEMNTFGINFALKYAPVRRR